MGVKHICYDLDLSLCILNLLFFHVADAVGSKYKHTIARFTLLSPNN